MDSPGGWQAIVGVTPDLTTLGKTVGGGLGAGALGGRADIMGMLEPKAPPQKFVFHTGTWNAIDLPDYITIVEEDYTEAAGRFLKSVVMVKVIDGMAQRFFSDQRPYILESIDRASKVEKFIEPKTLPHTLAERFQLPEDSISTALSLIQDPPIIFAVIDPLQARSSQDA